MVLYDKKKSATKKMRRRPTKHCLYWGDEYPEPEANISERFAHRLKKGTLNPWVEGGVTCMN